MEEPKLSTSSNQDAPPPRRRRRHASYKPLTNRSNEASPRQYRTNQQDRFQRPSLAYHGARPNVDRTASPRRVAGSPELPAFHAVPRGIGRNPRLESGRPPLRRGGEPGATPSPSASADSRAANDRRLNRRRFTVLPNRDRANQPNPTSAPQVIGTAGRKLRIIPLGGAGETGARNMTVFEYGNDIVVIDCGIMFPDSDMPGVDAVIPDVTYLVERKQNLRGIVFSHGHDDHIGAVPYLWPKLQCRMYATPLTCGLIQHKLTEAGVTDATLTVVEAGDKIHFGQISVEMVRLTHSIPDVLGLAIRCPAGLFFYATDWRLEYTPALGKSADWIRVAELGGEGITGLFSDSTNVDRPGYSPSEKMIGEAFDRIFQEAKGRIIVAQFSSQINRIQQVINSAVKFGRKIAISGRSMENYINIAMGLGYLRVPEGLLVDIRKVNTLQPRGLAIMSTGSQGEEYSSLQRISEGEHRHIKLDKTDTVVISASAVPGNESAVDKMINNLYREGANVMHSKLMSDIHVSGHPSRDELKLMFALTQPRFFIPIHGDYHRMVEHGKIATEMGVATDNVILMENGTVVEFDEKGGRLSGEKIVLEDIMIDGTGVGDVGTVVIRDRQILGDEGMVNIFLVVKQKTSEMVTSPDIITRGFIYVREAEDLMNQLREEIKRSYAAAKGLWGNPEELKQRLRDDVSKFLFQRTGRNPMVIPVVVAV